MTPELIKAFTTQYIVSLAERTRDEKSGVKWGIDWVVYNLGQALFGKPVRLPFLRQPGNQTARSKTETEFGIDLAFVSKDEAELTIFVLKDEQLTNKTWTNAGFYEDMSKAIMPDLAADGLQGIKSVRVVLAYNKDETLNGVELYDRFVGNAPKRLADRADLVFSRWNLSELVDLTLRHLLTPAILPQRFFGQLNYLCAQVGEFIHGSDQWEMQLVPSWKRFVEDVLNHDSGPRGVSLIPIALIILKQHGSGNRSIETGTIDLIEWAAIALWRRFAASDDQRVRGLIAAFWKTFYLQELDRFYRAHIEALGTPHAIDELAHASMVGVIAASATAYWHIARIGILSLGLSEDMLELAELEPKRKLAVRECANWLIQILNANEAGFRPVLDIHHIQLALLAFALHNAGRRPEWGKMLPILNQRLFLRRFGYSDLPFVDGNNSLPNVFEQVALGNKEPLITTQSSFLVLMLLELCWMLPKAERDAILPQMHRRLVLGAPDTGEIGELKPLHLISWLPPENWDIKMLEGAVEDGEEVTRGPLSNDVNADAATLSTELEGFVRQMVQLSKLPNAFRTPSAALILASIRFESPLPPELWRMLVFPHITKETEPPKS